MATIQPSDRYLASRRVTLVGACANIFLAAIKIIGGYISNSQALFADGVHSLSDLLTDILVIVAARFGSADADSDHPYGHGRIETAATLFLALMLVVVGLAIIVDASFDLPLHHVLTHPTLVLSFAFISIIIKEVLYHYTQWTATRVNSALLSANAWHHRSDALSSIVVFIGVTATLFGFHAFDAVAAIIVGVLIAKMGMELGWEAVRELIDTGVDPETLALIEETIQSIPGVVEQHQLRSRMLGGDIFIDVHVIVSPWISVSEGHHIGDRVQRALLALSKPIRDVTVHIDPEDDEVAPPTAHLPSREQLEPLLQERWQDIPEAEQIKTLHLHYLDGHIHVEAVMPMSAVTAPRTVKELCEALRSALTDIEAIKSFKLFVE